LTPKAKHAITNKKMSLVPAVQLRLTGSLTPPPRTPAPIIIDIVVQHGFTFIDVAPQGDYTIPAGFHPYAGHFAIREFKNARGDQYPPYSDFAMIKSRATLEKRQQKFTAQQQRLRERLFSKYEKELLEQQDKQTRVNIRAKAAREYKVSAPTMEFEADDDDVPPIGLVLRFASSFAHGWFYLSISKTFIFYTGVSTWMRRRRSRQSKSQSKSQRKSQSQRKRRRRRRRRIRRRRRRSQPKRAGGETGPCRDLSW